MVILLFGAETNLKNEILIKSVQSFLSQNGVSNTFCDFLYTCIYCVLYINYALVDFLAWDYRFKSIVT